MSVLICAASRHGATREIALALAEALADEGLRVAVKPPEEVFDLEGYGALVLGSAVYLGHWLPSAKDLAHRIGGRLEGRAVWLFSSDPVGDPPVPAPDSAVHVKALMEATGARGHHLFGGSLARSQLGRVERVAAAALHVPDADRRDWDEIAAWAHEIACDLRSASGTETQRRRFTDV